MHFRRSPASAGPRGHAGAFLFAGLVLTAGCRDTGGTDPRLLDLGSDTIVLPDSIALLDVRIGRGDDGTTAIEPQSANVHGGDVVRFVSLDHGAHAIAFDATRLSAEARTFLERTGQLRGPPLLDRGDAWVVNLVGAPAGTYPFACATHGESGTLTVTTR